MLGNGTLVSSGEDADQKKLDQSGARKRPKTASKDLLKKEEAPGPQGRTKSASLSEKHSSQKGFAPLQTDSRKKNMAISSS